VDEVMIRPATRDDADAIARLWEQLVAYHRALDDNLPVAAPDGAQRYAERLIDRLEDSQTCVLVAQEGRKIVGFVLGVVVDLVPEMFVSESGGFLADVFVEQAYRRRGIGQALVNALADWFRQQGLEHFEWYVAARNHEGRAFWQALGGVDVMLRMRVQLGEEKQ
jgi:GNAT superfamily N-acetyltransferase